MISRREFFGVATVALAAVATSAAGAIACDPRRIDQALHEIEGRLREVEREAGRVEDVQWKIDHIRAAMRDIARASR